MALSDYKIPRTEVPLDAANTVSVRGLNLEDVAFLVQVHKNDIDAVIEAIKGNIEKGSTPEDVAAAVESKGTDVLTSVIQQSPLLVANIISTASDEPDAWETAVKLPVPVQIEILLNVAKLTFNDIDGFKKFVGNVSAVMQSVAKQKPQIGKPATRSTGTTA